MARLKNILPEEKAASAAKRSTAQAKAAKTQSVKRTTERVVTKEKAADAASDTVAESLSSATPTATGLSVDSAVKAGVSPSVARESLGPTTPADLTPHKLSDQIAKQMSRATPVADSPIHAMKVNSIIEELASRLYHVSETRSDDSGQRRIRLQTAQVHLGAAGKAIMAHQAATNLPTAMKYLAKATDHLNDAVNTVRQGQVPGLPRDVGVAPDPDVDSANILKDRWAPKYTESNPETGESVQKRQPWMASTGGKDEAVGETSLENVHADLNGILKSYRDGLARRYGADIVSQSGGKVLTSRRYTPTTLSKEADGIHATIFPQLGSIKSGVVKTKSEAKEALKAASGPKTTGNEATNRFLRYAPKVNVAKGEDLDVLDRNKKESKGRKATVDKMAQELGLMAPKAAHSNYLSALAQTESKGFAVDPTTKERYTVTMPKNIKPGSKAEKEYLRYEEPKGAAPTGDPSLDLEAKPLPLPYRLTDSTPLRDQGVKAAVETRTTANVEAAKQAIKEAKAAQKASRNAEFNTGTAK